MNRILKLLAFSLTLVASVFIELRAETYSFEVGQFEKLKINGDFNVIFKCLADSAGFVSYEARDGMGDVFSFDLKKDGTLKIQLTDKYWGKPGLPVLHLYSDFLSGVENSSEESVEVLDLVPCAAFNANQIGNGSITVENLKCTNVTASITTGNGSINLSGKCVNANFRMLGAGLISADRLSADNVKCSILGTGSIGCWPLDNLSVKGIGSTKIYYKGKPNIKKTGGGKLFELPIDDNLDKYNGTPLESIEEIEEVTEEVTVVAEDDDDDEVDEEDDDEEEDDEEDDDDNYQTVVTADD